MSLHKLLSHNWHFQLQTWAANGQLFSAGVDALRLKAGQATDQLNRIAKRLANREKRGLPSLEALHSHSISAKD